MRNLGPFLNLRNKILPTTLWKIDIRKINTPYLFKYFAIKRKLEKLSGGEYILGRLDLICIGGII